jgi:hypothetical protein
VNDRFWQGGSHAYGTAAEERYRASLRQLQAELEAAPTAIERLRLLDQIAQLRQAREHALASQARSLF